MSDDGVVLLRTSLFSQCPELPLPQGLADTIQFTELKVDAHTTAEEWDRVLRAVVDRNRCITL